MKHTNEDLYRMQSWTLGKKIQVSQTRILEWCLKYDWEVSVSFSGGKDSCVLADLVARVWKVNDIKIPLPLVFSDTGMEFIEIKKHVNIFGKYLEDKYGILVDVIIIKPELNTYQVYKEIGYPIISKQIARQLRYLSDPREETLNSRRLYTTGIKSDGTKSKSFKLAEKWKKLFNVDEEEYTVDLPFKVSDECCNYFKKQPLTKYQNEQGKKPIIGTMADESRSRQGGWLRTGCNNFKNGQSKPISFWLEQDVLKYIVDFEIPLCNVYGDIVEDSDGKLTTTGQKNTGCKYCLFGIHLEKGENRFERLKKLEPKSYEYAMREENGLGLEKVLDFLNIKH